MRGAPGDRARSIPGPRREMTLLSAAGPRSRARSGSRCVPSLGRDRRSRSGPECEGQGCGRVRKAGELRAGPARPDEARRSRAEQPSTGRRAISSGPLVTWAAGLERDGGFRGAHGGEHGDRATCRDDLDPGECRRRSSVVHAERCDQPTRAVRAWTPGREISWLGSSTAASAITERHVRQAKPGRGGWMKN